MRIVYQCEALWTDAIGGLEVLASHMVPALRARGHEVLVIADRTAVPAPDRDRIDGVDVARFAFSACLAQRRLDAMHALQRELDALFAQFAPEVVHLNHPRPSSFFFLRRGATTSVPRVLSVHAPVGGDRAGLERRLVDEADRVLCVSDALARDVHASFAPQSGKCRVLHNALPLPSRAPSPPPSEPMLLAFGRMVPEKGFDTALHALAILRQTLPATRLVLAGDGPERATLERLARTLGLTQAVRFEGWVAPARMPDLIDAARVVLMPSRWAEPFGLAALQTAHAARPIVATAVGGLPEVVQHGHGGWLVPPDDAVAMAAAALAPLRDAALARRAGEQARERARRCFDFEHMLDEYEAEFLAAIAARRGARSSATEAACARR